MGSFILSGSFNGFTKECILDFHFVRAVFSFGITIFLSHYPVRAGSEIDIILAAIAFSFLFFCYQEVDVKKKMQLLGGTLLLLLHLTLCFTVAQNRPISGNLLRDAFCFYCFNPTTPYKFIACPSVRCPFDYTNYSGLFAAMAWPFFIGLIQVTKNIIVKWLYIFGVGYSFAIVFVSDSRAAFDLSLLFIFVYPLGWFLLKQKRFLSLIKNSLV